MAKLDIWICFVCVLGIVPVEVAAVCEDTVSGKNPLDILDSEGKVIDTVKSCKKLVIKYPSLCEKVGMDGEKCCKACGDHTCLDKVARYTPYIVNGETFYSCKKLVRRYPVVCRDIGGKYGECCRACKNVDTSCVDELVKYNGMDCAAFVKQDKCLCAEDPAMSNCCASCKASRFDAETCGCRDFLSKESPAKITITDLDKKVVVSKDVDNCKEIIQYYAEFCEQLGEDGKACCETCKHVDHKCFDNLSWKVTVKMGSKICKDCNCHDLRRKGNGFMKKACKLNLKGNEFEMKAQEACCLQCSRVKIK